MTPLDLWIATVGAWIVNGVACGLIASGYVPRWWGWVVACLDFLAAILLEAAMYLNK